MATRKAVPVSSGESDTGRLRKGEAVVLARLAAGDTQAAAAKAGGVTDRTVRDWLNEPEFKRRVIEARSDLLGQAVGILAHGAGEAARFLVDVAAGRVASGDSARVHAARAVLTLAPALRESGELAEEVARIAALVDGTDAPARRVA